MSPCTLSACRLFRWMWEYRFYERIEFYVQLQEHLFPHGPVIRYVMVSTVLARESRDNKLATVQYTWNFWRDHKSDIVYEQAYAYSIVNIIQEMFYPVAPETVLVAKEGIEDVKLETFWTLEGTCRFITACTFPCFWDIWRFIVSYWGHFRLFSSWRLIKHDDEQILRRSIIPLIPPQSRNTADAKLRSKVPNLEFVSTISCPSTGSCWLQTGLFLSMSFHMKQSCIQPTKASLSPSKAVKILPQATNAKR